MKKIYALGIVLAGILVLAGCTQNSAPSGITGNAVNTTNSYYGNTAAGSGNTGGGPNSYYSNATAGDDNHRARGSGSAPSVKEFTVTASKFAFDPGTITVNKGDTVIIHLTSTDVTHGLALSAYNVNAVAGPGQTQTIQFVADRAGTFEFHCNTPCGPGHLGMKGTLIVNG